MPVHIKGIVLKSRMEYVEKNHGKDALERVIEALSPEARTMVGGEILVSSWYPLQAAIETLVTIDRLLGNGDLALCEEMGRYTARTALSGGVQQSFARENDPAFVIKISPIIWSQYYDSGRLTTASAGPGAAVIRLEDFEEPHQAICRSMQGWLQQANEIWGGRSVEVIETRCRTREDPCCEFLISWTDVAGGEPAG
jgi:predicted hydrocarbon binding protein